MGPPGMETAEVVAARGYHSLRSREARPPIPNWHAFLTCWNNAEDHQRQISLLHEGYILSLDKMEYSEGKYREEDRHIFYFTIADGWDGRDFPDGKGVEYLVGYDKDWNPIRSGRLGLCQDLASKAFNMLATNFFRKMVVPLVIHRDDSAEYRAWLSLITDDSFLSVIQGFFRIEEELGQLTIRNLTACPDRRSHYEEMAVTFLLNLSGFIWRWREPEIETWREPEVQERQRTEAAAIRSRIEAVKPWLIEVLYCLGRLDILDWHILELSQHCLGKLREVALRSEFNTSRHHQLVTKDRRAKTIEETCLLESKAGLLLVRHRIMSNESKRLKRVRKTELAAAEAQERARQAKGRKK